MKKEWWQDAFISGTYPLGVFSNESLRKKHGVQEVSFFLKKSRLKPGSKVLDVACGVGRHSLPLARRSYRVTGVDISPVYLREAKKYARQEGLDVRFICRDMRKIDFSNEFDAAINMWTSFGYFKSKADDLRILKKINHALKPGGFFFLDTINGDFICEYGSKSHWSEMPGGYVLERVEVDKKQRLTRSHWIFLIKNKKSEMRSVIRLYSRPMIEGLLNKAGFKVIGIWGDREGSRYKKLKSIRLMILARKR